MTSETTTILTAIARLEVKVDGLVGENTKADQLHLDHEQRIRRLERWMFILTGIAAAGGSAAGTIVSRAIGG